jgi:prevent-host-death family protein
MPHWQLQTAKQKLSEVVDRAAREGPQTITRHGVEVAVVVGVEEFRRLGGVVRPSLKEVLLRGIGIAGGLDLEAAIPRRGRLRARPPISFDD